MTYIAHTKENSEEIQTLRDHLWNSKMYAEKYGDILGIPHVTGVAALVHDLGKYRQEFQKYIRHSEKPRKAVLITLVLAQFSSKRKLKNYRNSRKNFRQIAFLLKSFLMRFSLTIIV
jgi:CRISPR-associated endonuclease/helicase Cas3